MTALSVHQQQALEILAAIGDAGAAVEGHATTADHGGVVNENTAHSLERLRMVELFPDPGYAKANSRRSGPLYWRCRITFAGRLRLLHAEATGQ